MQRRSLVFIILNVIISLGVALLVIGLWNSQNPPTSRVEVITVEVRITNTPDPNATIPVRIITATPLPGSIGVLPTDLLDNAATAEPLLPDVTQDASAISGILGENTALQSTATALPPGCILHVIAAGDTPFAVAEQYGANGFDLMAVNGLNDETAAALQIGDVLIVPLETCPLTAADVAAVNATEVEDTTLETTAEATAEATTAVQVTARPTLTLPPTATNAQVEITEVVGAGDVTTEGVVIRNRGNTINVNAWTLSDDQNNTYTFSERVLFSNAQVTVFTRVGEDTAIALFWDKGTPLFSQPGAVLTLRDKNGTVQSTYRVPTAQGLP